MIDIHVGNIGRWSTDKGVDSPEKYANAPVSLQLVGRRYEDEKVVEALEYIKEQIGLPFTEFM